MISLHSNTLRLLLHAIDLFMTLLEDVCVVVMFVEAILYYCLVNPITVLAAFINRTLKQSIWRQEQTRFQP